MMNSEETRAWIEARRRRLVGSSLAGKDQAEFVEATFEIHFGSYFRQPAFWPAFEQACRAVYDGSPWHLSRQLMIAYSLPNEINAKDDCGETMLTLAATFGRAKVVNILCQVKGNPHIENAKGWSTVHIAAAYNHIDILQVLLVLNISVNEPDSRLGYTPLHIAASVDNIDVLRCLHASGKADFTKIARNGFTVLHVASANASEECVKFLITTYPDLKYRDDHILKENPAHKAAKGLHSHIYKHLIAHGTRDDLENISDDTADELAGFNTRFYY